MVQENSTAKLMVTPVRAWLLSCSRPVLNVEWENHANWLLQPTSTYKRVINSRLITLNEKEFCWLLLQTFWYVSAWLINRKHSLKGNARRSSIPPTKKINSVDSTKIFHVFRKRTVYEGLVTWQYIILEGFWGDLWHVMIPLYVKGTDWLFQ